MNAPEGSLGEGNIGRKSCDSDLPVGDKEWNHHQPQKYPKRHQGVLSPGK